MNFKIGEVVYDSGWPERHGVIIQVGKTTLRVRWDASGPFGEEWSYDIPHMKFLYRLRPRRPVSIRGVRA